MVLFDNLNDFLYERKFTEEKRKELATKGCALPNGSYPIEDEGDLKNAIRAYGRAADKPAVKAHIKKRAHALGRTTDLPTDWEKVNEVLHDEDEWANRQIAKNVNRYSHEETEEPTEKDFDWKEHIPDDEVDPDNMPHISDMSREDFEEATRRMDAEDQGELEDQASIERNMIIDDLNYLEEYIWENGTSQQLGQWSDYVRRYGEPGNIVYKQIEDIEILEELLYKAKMMVNQMKYKS